MRPQRDIHCEWCQRGCKNQTFVKTFQNLRLVRLERKTENGIHFFSKRQLLENFNGKFPSNIFSLSFQREYSSNWIHNITNIILKFISNERVYQNIHNAFHRIWCCAKMLYTIESTRIQFHYSIIQNLIQLQLCKNELLTSNMD